VLGELPLQVLARLGQKVFPCGMVIIRFDDNETEKRAMDYLVGRYSFKTWANGDLMLPEAALGGLAGEGLAFHVEGRANYGHFLLALRNPAAASV
jgi:hypothetical protein